MAPGQEGLEAENQRSPEKVSPPEPPPAEIWRNLLKRIRSDPHYAHLRAALPFTGAERPESKPQLIDQAGHEVVAHYSPRERTLTLSNDLFFNAENLRQREGINPNESIEVTRIRIVAHEVAHRFSPSILDAVRRDDDLVAYLQTVPDRGLAPEVFQVNQHHLPENRQQLELLTDLLASYLITDSLKAYREERQAQLPDPRIGLPDQENALYQLLEQTFKHRLQQESIVPKLTALNVPALPAYLEHSLSNRKELLDKDRSGTELVRLKTYINQLRELRQSLEEGVRNLEYVGRVIPDLGAHLDAVIQGYEALVSSYQKRQTRQQEIQESQQALLVDSLEPSDPWREPRGKRTPGRHIKQRLEDVMEWAGAPGRFYRDRTYHQDQLKLLGEALDAIPSGSEDEIERLRTLEKQFGLRPGHPDKTKAALGELFQRRWLQATSGIVERSDRREDGRERPEEREGETMFSLRLDERQLFDILSRAIPPSDASIRNLRLSIEHPKKGPMGIKLTGSTSRGGVIAWLNIGASFGQLDLWLEEVRGGPMGTKNVTDEAKEILGPILDRAVQELNSELNPRGTRQFRLVTVDQGSLTVEWTEQRADEDALERLARMGAGGPGSPPSEPASARAQERQAQAEARLTEPEREDLKVARQVAIQLRPLIGRQVRLTFVLEDGYEDFVGRLDHVGDYVAPDQGWIGGVPQPIASFTTSLGKQQNFLYYVARVAEVTSRPELVSRPVVPPPRSEPRRSELAQPEPGPSAEEHAEAEAVERIRAIYTRGRRSKEEDAVLQMFASTLATEAGHSRKVAQAALPDWSVVEAVFKVRSSLPDLEQAVAGGVPLINSGTGPVLLFRPPGQDDHFLLFRNVDSMESQLTSQLFLGRSGLFNLSKDDMIRACDALRLGNLNHPSLQQLRLPRLRKGKDGQFYLLKDSDVTATEPAAGAEPAAAPAAAQPDEPAPPAGGEVAVRSHRSDVEPVESKTVSEFSDEFDI